MQRSSMLMFITASLVVTAGNACAYLVQLLAARGLSPSDYGAFNALLALSMTLVAPLAVAPMVISKQLLEHESEPKIQSAIVRQVTVVSLLVGALIWLLHLPFLGFIESRLQVSQNVSSILLPLLVVSTFLFHVPIGIWQGQRNYTMMSVGVAAVPILRFGATLVLVTIAGGRLTATLWALIFGGLAVFVWGLAAQKKAFTMAASAPAAGALRKIIVFAVPASLGTLCLSALAYVDQPIVRALATAEGSGQYAAAATIAKIALLLPAAVTGIAFPEFARLGRLDSESRRAGLAFMTSALLFTVVASGAAALVMVAAPQLMLELMVGKAYGAAAPLLRLLAPAMSCLAVVTLVITYAIALGRLEMLLPTTIGIVIIIAAPPLLRLDTLGMAWLMLIVLATLSASCIAWLVVTQRRHLVISGGGLPRSFSDT